MSLLNTKMLHLILLNDVLMNGAIAALWTYK